MAISSVLRAEPAVLRAEPAVLRAELAYQFNMMRLVSASMTGLVKFFALITPSFWSSRAFSRACSTRSCCFRARALAQAQQQGPVHWHRLSSTNTAHAPSATRTHVRPISATVERRFRAVK